MQAINVRRLTPLSFSFRWHPPVVAGWVGQPCWSRAYFGAHVARNHPPGRSTTYRRFGRRNRRFRPGGSGSRRVPVSSQRAAWWDRNGRRTHGGTGGTNHPAYVTPPDLVVSDSGPARPGPGTWVV